VRAFLFQSKQVVVFYRLRDSPAVAGHDPLPFYSGVVLGDTYARSAPCLESRLTPETVEDF
jgi:hypothetical protein